MSSSGGIQITGGGITREIKSIAPLAGSAVFTSPSLDLGTDFQFKSFDIYVFAVGAAGNLYVEQSRDGVTFRRTHNVAAADGVLSLLSGRIMARYIRMVYVNGLTAQTVFDLQCVLRA